MSVRLPRLFSEGMVLQRGERTRLWGWADEAVTVTFQGRSYAAQPGADGLFEVFLYIPQAGGPFPLVVNGETALNAYVGEVWLLAGQSNMVLPMRRCRYMYPDEVASPAAGVHQFAVPQRTDFHAPQDDLDGGRWVASGPDTVLDFSAAGYFFAKKIAARYNTPVGLLLTAIGGTPVHAWMPREALAAFPDLLTEADACRDDGAVARIIDDETAFFSAFYHDLDARDPGLAQSWFAPDFDGAAWADWDLDTSWAGCGTVWLRRTVIIPPRLAGREWTLFLGTVTDADTAYVNGERVGSTGYQYPPREYTTPPLPAGPCQITLRVVSKNGGAFTKNKPRHLSCDLGSIPLDGAAWKFHRGSAGNPPPAETFFHYKPTGLFGGMIAPLTRMTVRGALWYQGESDAHTPARYGEKLEGLLRGWRRAFGRDFPFLFVELPHWSGENWDALRREQRSLLSAPGTGMVSAYDLGEDNDLHPQGKMAVGERLARLAMRVAYGDGVAASPFEVVGAWAEGRE